MFSLAALMRSSKAFLPAYSTVARPWKDLTAQVSASSSRNTTCGSFGWGKWPNVLPDGITKETNHSSACGVWAFLAAITGAVMAIFSADLLPLEIYLKREEKAELVASEYCAITFTSAITHGRYSRISNSGYFRRSVNSCRLVILEVYSSFDFRGCEKK